MVKLSMEKRAALKSLEVELREKFEKNSKNKIWLFPRGNTEEAIKYLERDLGKEVMGFWGTGEKPSSNDVIMIIAERPSVGYGNKVKQFDRKLGRFYEVLEHNDLGNSHLTDFIKTRARASYDLKKQQRMKFYEDEFDEHLPFLRKEIDIIKPSKVIALGEKTYQWVAICKSFFNLKAKLFCAPHYANRFQFRNSRVYEKEFLNSISEA